MIGTIFFLRKDILMIEISILKIETVLSLKLINNKKVFHRVLKTVLKTL